MTDEPLSSKQKVALLHTENNSNTVDVQQALSIKDEQFTADMLKTSSSAIGIMAAGIGPQRLVERHGLENLMDFRELEFDAIDLVASTKFTSELIRIFGAREVIGAFLTTPGDAVVLSGSQAAVQLGITTSQLLMQCAGAPLEAKNVIQQLNPRESCLQGVPFSVVADTGMRALAFAELGLMGDTVRQQMGLTTDQTRLLGFV